MSLSSSLVDLMLSTEFMSGVWFNTFLLDFNTSVIHISELVACCSLEKAQGSLFHFFHVEIGHNQWYWRCTSMLQQLHCWLEVMSVQTHAHKNENVTVAFELLLLFFYLIFSWTHLKNNSALLKHCFWVEGRLKQYKQKYKSNYWEKSFLCGMGFRFTVYPKIKVFMPTSEKIWPRNSDWCRELKYNLKCLIFKTKRQAWQQLTETEQNTREYDMV